MDRAITGLEGWIECFEKAKLKGVLSNNIYMKDCVLFDMARAGIWYKNDITVEDTQIEAPKLFRRSSNINLKMPIKQKLF